MMAYKKVVNEEFLKWELLNEYVVQQALIVLLVLLIWNEIIKKATRVKVRLFPFTLLLLGIVFSVALIGFKADVFLRGILVSCVSLFGNQLFKQAIWHKDDEEVVALFYLPCL